MNNHQSSDNCPQCGHSHTLTDSSASSTTMHCPRCGYQQLIDHHHGTIKHFKGYGAARLYPHNGIATVISFTHSMHWDERKKQLLDVLHNDDYLAYIVVTRKRRGEWIEERMPALQLKPIPAPLNRSLMTEQELLEEQPF